MLQYVTPETLTNHTDMSEYWTDIPRAESGQETEMVVPT